MSTVSRVWAEKLRPRFRQCVSPAVTYVSSAAFLERHSLASYVKLFLERLEQVDSSWALAVRFLLYQNGIAWRSLCSCPTGQIDHTIMSPFVTQSKYHAVAEMIARETGRHDLLNFLDRILAGHIVDGTLTPAPTASVTLARRRLADVLPRIQREMRRHSGRAQPLKESAVDAALNLALEGGATRADDLIYRMRKMAEIGGREVAVVASLFMDVPYDELPRLLRSSTNEDLRRHAASIFTMNTAFQRFRDGFEFDAAELLRDDTYLYRKTAEFVRRIETPGTSLLFFLSLLNQARRMSSDRGEEAARRVTDPIRFLFAPFAERTRLVYLADDLRDQVFRLEYPNGYALVEDQVIARTGMNYQQGKLFLGTYCEGLYAFIRQKSGLNAQNVVIVYREKSPHSLWQKVEVVQECGWKEINDIYAATVICESIEQARALARLFGNNLYFREMPRFSRDTLGTGSADEWHGIKKVGMMQGSVSAPIELQFVPLPFHYENESGAAAHWQYKLSTELHLRRARPQKFYLPEPTNAIGTGYHENFLQIQAHGAWTIEEIRSAVVPVECVVIGGE